MKNNYSKLLEIYVNSSNIGLLTEAKDRTVLYVNNRFCEIFSIPVPPEQLKGANCINLLEQGRELIKNFDFFSLRVEQLIEEKREVNAEVVELTNGRTLHRDYIPIFEEGEYTGHFWNYTDVTETQMLNRKLENYLYALDQSARVVITDTDGVITFVNDMLCKTSKYSEEELIGKTNAVLNSGYHSKAFFEELWSTIRAGKVWRGEIKNKAKDGAYYWLDTVIVPFLDDEGKPVQYVSIRYDITKRKEDEINIREANEMIKKSLQVKETFLTNISHELRTPINALVGFADLLKDTPLSDDQDRYITSIVSSAELLLRIINDLLDVAKLGAGEMTLVHTHFDLYETLESTIDLFKGHIKNDQVYLKLSIDNTVPRHIISDSTRLKQIMLNLVSNSVKFTSHGEIKVSVRSFVKENRNWLRLDVADTGLGITEEKRELILKPFVQVENGMERTFGGPGLGLSIVKHLVDLFGGEMDIESEWQVGSTFSITIPIEVTNEESLPYSKSKKAIDPSEIRSGIRVLLVEDNTTNQELAKIFLLKWNCKVTIAENGQEAIDEVKRGKFDIILMDIQMPVMDGYRATEIIREEQLVSDSTPVIAMTAAYGLKDIEVLEGKHFTESLLKPYKAKQLFDLFYRFFGIKNQKPKEVLEGRSPLVDIASFQEDTLQDFDLQKILINTMKNEFNLYFEKTEDLMHNRDAEELQKLTHKLKSTLGVIPISLLRQKIVDIEALAKEGHNFEEIGKLLRECRELYTKSLAEIEIYLKSSENA